MNLHKGVYFSLRMTREVLMEQLIGINGHLCSKQNAKRVLMGKLMGIDGN